MAEAVMELNYDFLRGVLIQERQNGGLSALDDSFYSKCDDFLKNQDVFLKNSFSLEGARVLENSRKIVNELREARMRKILFKALRDLEANAINSSGLASEEKDFYRSIVSLLNSYKTSVSQQNASVSASQGVSVRILADLPKMEMADGTESGPFSSGEIVALDESVAGLLLERKAAVRV
ncbi:MAG TPA: hypothetical protein VJI71_03475 [Candidatus Norongarragalinales archaeon]|nr:hypothetical protein [Candidatus Norongarragalinales archaeon]